MLDAYNPTYQEVREWAYGGEECYPVEDWDIAVFHDVTDDTLTALVLALASDPACPKQKDFVHFLNVMTGTVVRFAAKNGFRQNERDKLEKLVGLAENNASPLVADWAGRSRRVLQSPSDFRYEEWF